MNKLNEKNHSSVKTGSVGNTSCQNAACSNEFFLWRVDYAQEENLLPLISILRGHDTHIDFLRLLLLVGMICPLIQEHFR